MSDKIIVSHEFVSYTDVMISKIIDYKLKTFQNIMMQNLKIRFPQEINSDDLDQLVAFCNKHDVQQYQKQYELNVTVLTVDSVPMLKITELSDTIQNKFVVKFSIEPLDGLPLASMDSEEKLNKYYTYQLLDGTCILVKNKPETKGVGSFCGSYSYMEVTSDTEILAISDHEDHYQCSILKHPWNAKGKHLEYMKFNNEIVVNTLDEAFTQFKTLVEQDFVRRENES